MHFRKNIFKKIGICLIAISLLGSSVNYSALAYETVPENVKEVSAVKDTKGSSSVKTSGGSSNDESSKSEEKTDDGSTVKTSDESSDNDSNKNEEPSGDELSTSEEASDSKSDESNKMSENESDKSKESSDKESNDNKEEISSVNLDIEKDGTEDALGDKEISDDEQEDVTFEETVTVGDVEITVSADAGVFPLGSSLEARKVQKSVEAQVEEAISEIREDDKNVAKSYTFDIKVLNKDGEEVEPVNKKGKVNVSFKLKETQNVNLDAEIYHVDDSDLTATELSVSEVGESGDVDAITVETDGFSYYTVEFTYNSMEYVLEGDEEVALTDILDKVKLDYSAGIEIVTSSNDDLFCPENRDGKWYIKAVNAFDTKELLTITIGGIDYLIDVTDANNVVSFTNAAGVTTNYTTFAEAVAAAKSSAGGKIKLLANTTAISSVKIENSVTLDLNSKTLTITNTTGVALEISGTNVTICGGGEINNTESTSIGYLLVTDSGTTCTIKDGVRLIGKLGSGYSKEFREIKAGDGSTIIFEDAYVETINENTSAGVGILVAWRGTIKVYDGTYIQPKISKGWSGVTDSVNWIYIYGGKFNGQIWQSGGGSYKLYGGHFTQNHVCMNSTATTTKLNDYVSLEGARLNEVSAMAPYI